MSTKDAGYLHEESYLWGMRIGLQTALRCNTQEEIEQCLALLQKPPVDGDAEYQSWMVELELHSWECLA